MISPHLKKLKTLTHQLGQKEQLSDSFFELSLDLLCVIDFEGKFVKINSAWAEFLGWNQKELVGEPYLNFVCPEDLDRTKEAHQNLCEGTKVIYLRNRFKCNDGSYRILCWTATPDVEHRLIYAVARDFSSMMDKISE